MFEERRVVGKWTSWPDGGATIGGDIFSIICEILCNTKASIIVRYA